LEKTPPRGIYKTIFLTILVNEYGYVLGQMDEEKNVIRIGSAKARADFVIW
jgi:acetyl-CoA carboxylase carboxyltransferase component